MSNSSPRNEAFTVAVLVGTVEAIVATMLKHSMGWQLRVAIPAGLPIAVALVLSVYWLLNRNKIADKALREPTVVDDVANLQPPPIKFGEEAESALMDLGIVGVTSRMSQSQFEPAECMRQARKSLDFMGILGSKWVIEPHVRADFRKFLTRVSGQNGSVRFLLINPSGTAYESLKVQRDGAISDESLKHFKALCKQFPCLEVRLFNQLPCFRLIFIDNSTLALARYKMDREGYFSSRYGWEAPHLIISPSAPWSLYAAFEYYFEQVWDTSQSIC